MIIDRWIKKYKNKTDVHQIILETFENDKKTTTIKYE